jgi:hypothetical protein
MYIHNYPLQFSFIFPSLICLLNQLDFFLEFKVFEKSNPESSFNLVATSELNLSNILLNVLLYIDFKSVSEVKSKIF